MGCDATGDVVLVGGCRENKALLLRRYRKREIWLNEHE